MNKTYGEKCNKTGISKRERKICTVQCSRLPDSQAGGRHVEIRRSFGPDAGFLRLLASQVRCVGKLSLGLQLLIFIFVLIVVTALTEEGPRGLVYLQNKGVLILCVSAVAAAWSSVPAFARSFRYNMAELEEASYFSLSRLMMARIVVCMGSAGIMAASIGGFVFVRNIVCFNELAAYLILPFLLSVACVFLFHASEKGTPCMGKYHIADSCGRSVSYMAQSLGI